MNSKLYGPRAQVTHISGEAQWRRGLPVGVDGDPVGVRLVDVVVGRVRVGAREDDHAELAAAGDQLAERVAVAQPAAAVVERNLAWGSRRRSRRRSGRPRRECVRWK